MIGTTSSDPPPATQHYITFIRTLCYCLLTNNSLNTGFAHLIYLFITLVFWIATAASLEAALKNGAYPHRTTIRATEW